MRDDRVIVFAGPSLGRAAVARGGRRLARIELRPPAQRGDVLAVLGDHPTTIVLLDGYFHTVPSVTHKELLYAIDSGVRVIGAASMGALRAAELERFGMRGVGRIFELLRGGEIEGDDEVAILHAPADLGYVPLTVALVELRLAVRELATEQCIAPQSGARFIDQVKALCFRDRRPARLRSLARAALGRAGTRRLERLLRHHRVKETDGQCAIDIALEPAEQQRVRRPGETTFLHRLKEQTLRAPATRPNASPPTVLQSWFVTQLFHPECSRFVRWLRLRHLLFSEGIYADLRVPAEKHDSVVRILKAHHERCFGAAWLPLPEYDEEARIHTTAEAACEAYGDHHTACVSLARRLGLNAWDGEEALLHLLERQPDALPSWWQARAFTFTEAADTAQALAGEARAVLRCFQRWSSGATMRLSSLIDVAASIWSCERSAVFAEGARRGLFLVPAASEGLREALELVAATERLPTAINDYVTLRRQLPRIPLRPLLEIAGSESGRDGRARPVPPHWSTGLNQGRRPFIGGELLWSVPPRGIISSQLAEFATSNTSQDG